MEIKTEKYFIDNAYVYDISSCHFKILEKFGYDVSNLDKDNKLKRNIQIGIMIKNNPKLSELLRGTTDSTISELITRNNIEENDIIIRQYDGLIIKKYLKNLDTSLEVEFRGVYNPMIISMSKNSYISKSCNDIIIKGISNVYDGIRNFYNKILNINFMNKKSIFNSLYKIKNDFYNSDINTFLISKNEEEFELYLKNYGIISLSKSSLEILDFEDLEIDKDFYYNTYLIPFTKSITYTFA